MNEWRKVKLGEIAEVTKLAGFEFTKYIEYVDDGEIIALRALNLKDGRLDLTDIKKIKKEISEKLIRSKLYKDDILLTYTGNGYGDCAIIKEDNKYHLAPNICKITANKKILNPYFLYSFIRTKQFYCHLSNYMVGSSQPTIPMRIIRELVIPIFNINLQNKIVKILSDIDEKIELNNKINDNLEKLIFLIYQNIFSNNVIKKECKMNEYFDISIGKTPPRKNQEYFSNNSNNNLWVSILDMKSSGIYINKSSEYLTDEAIKKCNVKIIPKNTLLLSFKLTIGRIAITYLDKTTTNEAIAHFLTDKKGATEYLYCYLKKFNFNTLGSTSSIATAVNSKIIKEMPFIIPQEKDLENFYNLVKPLFENIENNQIESEKLTNLKNYLLPKLMNGEIDVEKIEL